MSHFELAIHPYLFAHESITICPTSPAPPSHKPIASDGFLVDGTLLRGYVPMLPSPKRPTQLWVWRNGVPGTRKRDENSISLFRMCYESSDHETDAG